MKAVPMDVYIRLGVIGFSFWRDVRFLRVTCFAQL